VRSAAVLGVDAGSGSLREADHLLLDLVRRFGLPAAVTGCTHLIRTGRPHIAVSLSLPAEVRAALDLAALPEGMSAVLGAERRGTTAGLIDGAAQAVAQHRRTGRAVVFRGASRLTGTVTVRKILDDSIIDRVAVLMGDEPTPDVRVETRDHIRPEWQSGRLTLLTLPAGDGLLAPYEVPNPTPCCQGDFKVGC
jgi:hypothetical protein